MHQGFALRNSAIFRAQASRKEAPSGKQGGRHPGLGRCRSCTYACVRGLPKLCIYMHGKPLISRRPCKLWVLFGTHSSHSFLSLISTRTLKYGVGGFALFLQPASSEQHCGAMAPEGMAALHVWGPKGGGGLGFWADLCSAALAGTWQVP